METLIEGLLIIVVVVVFGDVLGSLGSRLLVRPGTTPPVWVEPLVDLWEERWGLDDGI